MSDLTVPPPMPRQRLLRRVMPDGHWYGDVYGHTDAGVRARDAIWQERIASLSARLEAAERDAARYRRIREAGSSLKLYAYDDPADSCSGDWRYKPCPEFVDEWCDAAASQEGKG